MPVSPSAVATGGGDWVGIEALKLQCPLLTVGLSTLAVSRIARRGL